MEMPLLRPITPADDPFLFELYSQSRAEELAAFPFTLAQRQAFLRMQFEAQSRGFRAQFPQAAFSLVLDGETGLPVGRFYVDRTAAEIRLIEITLLAQRRGAGLGSRLIRGLLDEAGQRGLPVRLSVVSNNRARSLYERLGFCLVDPQPGDDGVYLAMEWKRV